MRRTLVEPAPSWPLPRSAWQRLGACRGMDLEVFFPPVQGSYAQARTICASCLVTAACRKFTDAAERDLPVGMIFGMYAGETPTERVARRRTQPSPDS